MDFTFSSIADRFPAGTDVGAFKRGTFGGPSGSADATATVGDDGTLTFTGLDAGTAYVAAAGDTYVGFTTPAASSGGVGGTTHFTEDEGAATVTTDLALQAPEIRTGDPTYAYAETFSWMRPGQHQLFTDVITAVVEVLGLISDATQRFQRLVDGTHQWFDGASADPSIVLEPDAVAGVLDVSAGDLTVAGQALQRASGLDIGWSVDPANYHTATGVPDGANRGVYVRATRGGTFSRLGVLIGASSGDISLAVYENVGAGENAAPGARKATTGAVACPAAGFHVLALDVTVEVREGDWFFVSADNIAASFMRALGAAQDIVPFRSCKEAAAHPAPANAGAVAPDDRPIIIIGLP